MESGIYCSVRGVFCHDKRKSHLTNYRRAYSLSGKIFILSVLCLAASLSVFSTISCASTNVSGTVSTDTTWTLSGSPYIVTGNITVQGTDGEDGVTALTIEPGVEVRFDAGTSLKVGADSGDPGALIASGSENHPIMFTANTDSPAPGYWKGIYFYDTTHDSASIIDHCIIEYGGHYEHFCYFYCFTYSYGNIAVSKASITIQNSVIRTSQGPGISVSSGNANISNCTIIENSREGILFNSEGYSMTPSSGVVSGNTITNNAIRGIVLYYGSYTITNNSMSNNSQCDLDFPIVFNNLSLQYSITDNIFETGINFTQDKKWYSDITGNTIGYSSPWQFKAEDLDKLSGILAGNEIINFDPGEYLEINGGEISQDVTLGNGIWRYHVLGTLTVKGTDGEDGVTTLTIEPGTELRFNAGTQLIISQSASTTYPQTPGIPGSLVAGGTQGQPITFTSNAATPAPGDWMGILFKGADNSTSLMDHCIVEYAGANNHNSCDPRVYNNDQHGGISCIGAGSNITIQNSVIRNNRCFGIFLYSSPAVITGNTIFENGEGGVCTYISSAIILNNIISNNGVYGIRAIYSHATIAHNTIDDNGTYGVLIEELGNSFNRIPVGLVFTYNTLSRNGQYDLYTLCTGDIDLSGDVFNTGIYAPNCTITADRIPPEEVRNLRVASGQTSLVFIWDPSLNIAGDLAGYRVYFDEDTQGVQVGPDQTSHEVTGLSPSSAYPCRITAYDTSGNESDGVQVIGYTLLSNPTNVMVTPYHEYAVLNWQAVEPSANVGYYRVYVSEMSFGSVEGMSPRAYSYTTSAQINNLQNGITYYFAVTAVNRSGGELKSVNTITATPLVDTSGPIINNLKLNGSVFNIGGTMTHSGTFTVSASDPSKVSRVEYYLDGVLAGTSYNSPFRFYLNIENLADGSHTLRVVAYDTFGNSTAMDHDFVILLAPPSAPVIKKPSSGLVTNNTEIAVSGTADKNTSVTVYLGGVSAGDPVAVGEGGTFSVRVTLNQGENHIRAAARNNAGEGPLSPVVVVTVDGSVPDAPQSLIAQAASGGAVKLSWYRPLNSAVTGYNIYR
ncbi:MAG: right-handed parallel beta-helix repeat-containing protein, partial [Desulfomonilia bacterium]